MKAIDPLEAKLRWAAQSDAPEFSPELHQRIMRNLHENGLRAEEPAPPRIAFWRLAAAVGVGLAAAAAIVLVVWLSMAGGGDPRSPRDTQMATGTGGSSVGRGANGGNLPRDIPEAAAYPLPAALQEGKYGYLDRDARRLMTFVANQVPGLPE